MELIIDIPEDVYTRLFDNGIQDNEIEVDDVSEMARALRLGRPIEQEPKTEHWIMVSDRTDWYDATFKCSCCDREIIIPYELKDNIYNDYPYCHCGAKMKSKEDNK